MSDIPIDERRFTEQEVREILKKTVERAPSRALVKSEGLSLADLKAIAQCLQAVAGQLRFAFGVFRGPRRPVL